MKRLISLFIILFSAQFSIAQINKGAILIEGTVTLSGSVSEDEFSNSGNVIYDHQRTMYFAGRPKIGFFTSGTFLVGVGVSYEHESIKYKATYPFDPDQVYQFNQKINTFSLNPYIRKYISLNDKLFLTITGSTFFGFGNKKSGQEGEEIETDLINFQVSIAPGVTYFLTDKVALTANFGSIYYMYSKEILPDENPDEDPINIDQTFGASFSLNTFGIGIQYYLRNSQ